MVAIAKDTLKDPLYKAGFTAAGIGLNTLGPKVNTGVAMFNDCWSDAESTITGGTWSDDPSSFIMVPVHHAHYQPNLWKYDSFDRPGYIREGLDVKAIMFGEKWTGDFRPKGN